jgi:AcrR family transcriptional regulator
MSPKSCTFAAVLSQDQKCHIIKTAGELFFRLGIRSVSIDDICRELGMSKKTFYVYFASKDELIEQMLDANVAHMEQKMSTTIESSDFRGILRKFTQWIATEKEDVRKVPQLVYDLKKYYPQQYNAFQRHSFETQQHYIEQFIERGMESGLVRANINKEYTSHLFAKIYTDALRDFEQIESKGHNLPQFSRVATDILMRGILSEEGLKLYNNE